MNPAQSIAPAWGAVVPMMVYAIATSTESETGAAAIAELQRMADILDAWNKRAPLLLELLHEARDAARDEDFRIAEENILRALALVGGES